MDVMSHTSTLNPNAPLFVPLAYRAVEDFSDQWWTLVHSSPWFRDYWLQERYLDPQTNPLINYISDPLDDLDSFFFEEDNTLINPEEDNGNRKDLVSMGALKWQIGRTQLARASRYVEKPPRIVNVKVSPRMIQQPR